MTNDGTPDWGQPAEDDRSNTQQRPDGQHQSGGQQPTGQQPHGQQPHPGQHQYGQQPYPGQPQYGDQPRYGGQQYGGQQYGDQPQYGAQQYGAQQYSGQPYAQVPQPIPVGPDGVPPLWAPWYGIGFLDAFTRFFKKYARFDGRASRSEFWYWILANAIVTIVLYGGFIAGIISWSVSSQVTDDYGYTHSVGAPPVWIFLLLGLFGLWWLGTIVPNLALGWRRVHDANLAGPFWLISLVTGIAGIVFGALESNPAGAQYDRPDHG